MPRGVYKRSAETKRNISLACKGKCLSEETKQKISLARKGIILSEKTKRKMSKAKKGKDNHRLGKHLSEETKQKMSEAHKGEKSYMLGKHLSAETKQKISEAHKGSKSHWFGKKGYWAGKKRPSFTKEAKQNMRRARFEYIKKTFGIVFPTIGRNEKQILDKLEQELEYRIIRQYEVGGYYLDGYISDLNVAIEIDEKHHKSKKEKDIRREEFIKQKLGCRFIRIQDDD